MDGIHSIGLPIQVYPMYENGFRAHRGQSLAENHMESASLYSRFSQVAVTRPYSWNFQSKVETPESIAQVTTKNRMICLPCEFVHASLKPEVWRKLILAIDPLLMNAFNSVNLAAACIVTTAEYAAELGVPRSKWIYPLGGAGATDSEEGKLTFFFTSFSVKPIPDNVQKDDSFLTCLSLESTQFFLQSRHFQVIRWMFGIIRSH